MRIIFFIEQMLGLDIGLHLSINQLLFDKKINSINNIYIEINNGLVLNNSLISNQNLRNVYLFLPTIDDLYILLDGLVPNVETMIIIHQ